MDKEAEESLKLFLNEEEGSQKEEDTIAHEIEYIRNLRMVGKIDNFDNDMISRHHKCSSSCKWLFLQPNFLFYCNGVRCRATGFVNVCKKYGSVHLCGSKYCSSYAIDSIESVMVCTITGIVFNERGVSLARTRDDPNVVILGEHVLHNFVHVGSSEEKRGRYEDYDTQEEECKQEKQIELSELEKRELRIEKKLMSPEEKKRLKEEAEKEKLSARNTEEIFNVLRKYSRGGDKEITHLISLYGHTSLELLISRLSERNTWRSVANKTWLTHIVSNAYMDELRKIADAANARWVKDIVSYYKGCIAKNIIPDTIYMTCMWYRQVAPCYKSIYYGGDVDVISNSIKDKCIECILRIWERIKDSRCVITNSKIRFDTCCTAILLRMQSGYSAKVYTIGSGNKPYYWSMLPKDLDEDVVEHDIEFIQPFPKLLLIDIAAARHLSQSLPNDDTTTKRKKSTKKQRTMNKHFTTIFSQRRRGFGTQQHNSAARINNNQTQVIPPLKYLNSIYSDIIENSEHIDDLKSFCTSQFCNNYSI